MLIRVCVSRFSQHFQMYQLVYFDFIVCRNGKYYYEERKGVVSSLASVSLWSFAPTNEADAFSRFLVRVIIIPHNGFDGDGCEVWSSKHLGCHHSRFDVWKKKPLWGFFLWVVQTPKTQDSEDDRFINEDQRARDGFFFFKSSLKSCCC